jgi:hypothetical protein
VEAEEIWVEAKAPVITRAATTERMMLFMGTGPFSCLNSITYGLQVSERCRRR